MAGDGALPALSMRHTVKASPVNHDGAPAHKELFNHVALDVTDLLNVLGAWGDCAN